MKEYRVYIYKEPMLGTLLFGQGKTNAEKLTRLLNDLAKEGWRVVAVEREVRRMLLVSSRDAFIFILERDKA